MVSLEDFTVFDFNLVVFAVIGVSFAIIWLTVNFYHFYPYVRLFVGPVGQGNRLAQRVYVSRVDLEDVDPDALPTIDVLLPAYKEGNVIHHSIRSIREADYPQELIRINVLLEPDDDDTRSALQTLADRFEFRELTIPADYKAIVVPDTYPGSPNKPRALNYGFEMTDGDVVGVIDAEDVVSERLFQDVYAGLIEAENDFVQGVLDMVNEGDGWLNTLFRAEYAWWFRWLLPSFYYSNFPVPLGGTTNFFHRSVLEEISERRYEEYGDPWDEADWSWFAEAGLSGAIPWDPRNVTEDFELGLFLWKEDYDIGLIRAVTREESPLSLNAWIRQRTRWQKGKIYTFIQYASTLPATWRARFHLLLQSFLPHLAPINLAGVVILALTANILGLGMPIGIFIALTVALVFLVSIAALYGLSYWYVTDTPIHRQIWRTLVVLVTLPIYWLPLWGAELRAIQQLYMDDLGWEKTPHHGRTLASDDAEGTGTYDPREVAIGLLVLFLGLCITFGLPLLLLG